MNILSGIITAWVYAAIVAIVLFLAGAILYLAVNGHLILVVVCGITALGVALGLNE